MPDFVAGQVFDLALAIQRPHQDLLSWGYPVIDHRQIASLATSRRSPPQLAAAPASLENRLSALKRICERDLVSEDEYQQCREVMLEGL